MKNLSLLIVVSSLVFCCAKTDKLPLKERVNDFHVSECRKDCWTESIGVKTHKTINGNLKVQLGYIKNCSWEKGYFKNITEINDTLIIEIDMPHTNGQYSITSCDCFFYFDFVIKDYPKTPKAIRVADLFDKNKFWDEVPIFEIEETTIDPNFK